MASVTLTDADFPKLSASARKEILDLIGTSPTASPMPLEGFSEWTPVPSVIMNKFMSGISEQSKELLKLLAKGNGELKWSQIHSLTKLKEWQDLKGFQAGMNRRLRGLIGDPTAFFVAWDESQTEYDENDRPVDGLLKVHVETAKSLRGYFRLT
jgi:hypothetical protein